MSFNGIITKQLYQSFKFLICYKAVRSDIVHDLDIFGSLLCMCDVRVVVAVIVIIIWVT